MNQTTQGEGVAGPIEGSVETGQTHTHVRASAVLHWPDKHYALVDAHGRIGQTGVAQADHFGKLGGNGWTAIETPGPVHSKLHYVKDGHLIDRPPCPVTLTIRGLEIILAGVPLNARIIREEGNTLHDTVHADPTGVHRAVVAKLGVPYSVLVECFPAQDFRQLGRVIP